MWLMISMAIALILCGEDIAYTAYTHILAYKPTPIPAAENRAKISNSRISR